jgi:hypothetical protein
MTNWFENLVYLTRNTSLTPEAIDSMSWYEYEMFFMTLSKALEQEAEKQKQQEKINNRQANPMNSMGQQMRNWFGSKLNKH